MIKVRLFEANDYPQICEWWQARKWPPMPLRYLPKNGIVSYDGDKLLAAAWLYFDTTSPVAWGDWLVSNPANSPRQSVKAILAVLDAMTITAKAFGAEIIMTAVYQERLAKLYAKKGFTESDKNMTIMFNTLIGGK